MSPCLTSLTPCVHIFILHIFPESISRENLTKHQSAFPVVIMLWILIKLSLDGVWMMSGENRFGQSWHVPIQSRQTTNYISCWKIYIYVSQLFISRIPKMRAIPQLVSAPINPIPIAEHFRRSHPPCEHSQGQHIKVRKITQSKIKTLINELNVHVNQINKQIMRALKIKLYAHTYL